MRENPSFAPCARALGVFALSAGLLFTAGCNSIFGIREGIGGEGGAGGSATGGGGTGGTGGGPSCEPQCTNADYGATEGPCAYQVLYTSKDLMTGGGATGIVVDEPRDRVLWARGDKQAIVATPRSGGTSIFLTDVSVGPGAFFPRSLGIAGDHAYWTDFYAGAVGRLDLAASKPFPELAASPPGMALSSSLAFHGGELFFATMVSTEQEANPWCHDPAMSGEPPATCTFRHWRAKTGTNETPVPFGPDVQRGIPGHASDETRLYWTECDEVGGTIHYLEDGNPDPQLLLQFGTPCGGELAVEPGPEGLVFWTGSNGIYRATKTGQNLGPLVDAEGPFSLLADGKHVYWIEGSNFFEGPEEDGSVRRVSRDGGPAVTLAPTHKPGALAQDCAAVYWTNTFLLFQPEQYIEIRKVSK